MLRRCLRASAAAAQRPALRNQQRRGINYGHDLHKEMLNGTAKVSVTDYDEGGFVVNDVNMRGGVALYPEIAMLWKPKRFEEITKESLTVFTVANPPIGLLSCCPLPIYNKQHTDLKVAIALEILVLGCGERIQHNLAPELKQFLKVNGIVVEYLDSLNACATFNILNAEDRKVAAAILPYDPDASKVF